MKFLLFDIDKVLKSGTFLLGSEGKEYEHEDEAAVAASVSGLDAKEKLASQRQLLNKKLGLDVAQKMGIDTSDIFTNDDLVMHTVDKTAQKKLKEAQRVNNFFLFPYLVFKHDAKFPLFFRKPLQSLSRSKCLRLAVSVLGK